MILLFVLILFINVNNFVVIFQDQYQSILVSFVMMLISLLNILLLYISIICQHFINYLLILFRLNVDILLMDNIHESNSTLFLMMLLLIYHLSNLKQSQILLQIVITFVKSVVESLILYLEQYGLLIVIIMVFVQVTPSRTINGSETFS